MTRKLKQEEKKLRRKQNIATIYIMKENMNFNWNTKVDGFKMMWQAKINWFRPCIILF